MNAAQLDNAAKILQQGGIVAFPTESSYGLAVDVRNEAALHRLYRLKQRPEDKPLLVLVSAEESILQRRLAAFFPAEYKPLVKQFWPGALTLIFPAHFSLSDVLTAGSGTVGIRISSHQTAQELTARFVSNFPDCGGAITATSANISGFPPCRSAREVRAMFAGGIDYLLDDGIADGVPSTLAGLIGGRLKVIRKGQITLPPQLVQ